jgi:hypothetical protein
MITFLSILGILALLGIVASVTALFTDGYRPVPTDWKRVRERNDSRRADPPPRVSRRATPPRATRTVAPARGLALHVAAVDLQHGSRDE